jgi:hypothetical protein
VFQRIAPTKMYYCPNTETSGGDVDATAVVDFFCHYQCKRFVNFSHRHSQQMKLGYVVVYIVNERYSKG